MDLALCFRLPLADHANAVPEWVAIIPAPDAKGVLAGGDGRTWRLRDAAALVAALNASPTRIPIDLNHATALVANTGQPSPAAGWFEEFELRDGQTWARVSWTEVGKAALNDRAYRYLSPALVHNRAGDVTGLHSVGLVNHPNFTTLPALNSGAAASKEPPAMKALMKKLGLSEEASEDAAIAAVDKLQNDHQVALNAAQTPDPTKFVPRADYEKVVSTNAAQSAELEKVRTKEIEAEVDTAIEAGKFAPASRDHYIALCAKEGGLELFRQLAESAVPIVGADKISTNATRGGGGGKSPTAEDKEVAAALGHDAGDYYK